MESFGISNRMRRAESIKKLVGILALVVAILCLVSSMALANPSTGTREAAGPSMKAGIWIACGTGKEGCDHLDLYGVRCVGKELSALEKQEASALRGERTSLPLDGKDGDSGQEFNNPTVGFGSDVSGYESRSHMLLKPVERPTPTILLVEERSSNGKLYLGLLALTIPW